MPYILLLIGLAAGGVVGWLLGTRKAAISASVLAAERERHQEDLKGLKDAFKSLSAEALQEARPEFIRQARESFSTLQENYKGDLAQRQEAIASLLLPLRQQLDTYQQRLQQSEGAQSSALGEVKKQLELLSQQSTLLASETEQFRRVIHSNQARGRWGEEKLRRVVEAAGMSPYCDFVEQSQEGDSKPDMLVNLPGSRQIIVDAKTPDFEFLSGLESADAGVRQDTLKLHARKIRDTISGLSARKYPGAFPNAMDHVVLFLPSESLFSAALEVDRDLILWASQQKVLLATPATLIGLLRSISLTWQQHAQMQNAQQIVKVAQELFDRVVVLIRHFEDVGSGLSKASGAYNSVLASYQDRLLPSGKRLMELGLSNVKGGLNSLEPLPIMPKAALKAENKSEN